MSCSFWLKLTLANFLALEFYERLGIYGLNRVGYITWMWDNSKGIR